MKIFVFKDIDGKEHVALLKGEPSVSGLLLRVHSECITGDVFGSIKCDCGAQLEGALSMISREDHGMLIYLRQEGRGIGLGEKIKAYNLQDQGMDTVEANLSLGHKVDERSYEVVGKILSYFKVSSIELVTNNPEKIKGIESFGIKVLKRIPSKTPHSESNKDYLKTKKNKLKHFIDGI